jgi:hypothetical protein
VTLAGHVGPADVRALQEAAVLADLQANQGVLRSLRNLPARGERNAIRDALLARAEGAPGQLSPEQQTTLDQWVAAKPVADRELTALASARAERVRATLAEQHGVDPARLTLGEPAIDREQGAPVVAVSLGAGS